VIADRRPEDLEGSLADVARRSDRHWRAQRTRAQLPRAIERALPALAAVPALLLLLQTIFVLAGRGDLSNAIFPAVLAALVVFGAAIAVQALAHYSRAVPRREALSLVDRELGLADRLTTADEFLAVRERSGFMQAAIEDAVPHAERARSAELRGRPDTQTMRTRALVWPAVGVALFAATLLVHGSASTAVPDASVSVASARDPSAGRRDPPKETPAETRPEAVHPREKAIPAPAAGRAQVSKRTGERDAAMEEKRAEGLTKPGESAAAAAPSGSASAKGQPTAQTQPSLGEEPKKKTQRKPKPQAARDEKPGERKDVKDSSGSTMSRGSGGGSTKNPVASEWDTKDEIQMPEDEKAEDDQDVDDEETKDESRGGMQPSLRDRRPPPNRDLSIGWGNQPGGEGRGGPSPQKKQRGTASLVLGVPIPDHVKGQINPGTTKITQERVRPTTEDWEALAACDETPRTGPAGHVGSAAVDPAVRRILRAYWLRARMADTQQ
jgi:hypothetical protein